MWTCFVWFYTNKCQLSSNYTIQLKLKYCDSMSSWSFVILADLNWSSQGNFIIAKLRWNHLKEQYNENRLTEIWAHVALFLAEGRDAEQKNLSDQHDHSAPLTLSSWLYRDLPFHNNGDHNFSSKYSVFGSLENIWSFKFGQNLESVQLRVYKTLFLRRAFSYQTLNPKDKTELGFPWKRDTGLSYYIFKFFLISRRYSTRK